MPRWTWNGVLWYAPSGWKRAVKRSRIALLPRDAVALHEVLDGHGDLAVMGSCGMRNSGKIKPHVHLGPESGGRAMAIEAFVRNSLKFALRYRAVSGSFPSVTVNCMT